MEYWEEKLRRRLKALDELGSRNSAVCRAFIGFLLASGLSHARACAYIDTFLTFGRRVRKNFEDVSREDVEGFFKWLKENGYRDGTISSMAAKLKRFYKWLLGDDDHYPPQVSWLKANSVKNKLPREILSVEEIKAMANAADNIRDKALVLVLYESGLRAGEFLDLRIRDIEVDEYGAVLHVSGKTGDRRVRIISSAPALLEWINHHPKKDDPDARVFGRYGDNRRMSYTALRNLLIRLAKKAGVRKNVHPHLFRHSRATHLARYLTESQLSKFFGWVQGSRMPQIYIHLSGRDLDPALLKLAGLEAEAEKVKQPEFTLQRCPRCGELNPPNEKTCRRCGNPLQGLPSTLLQSSDEKVKKLEKRIEKLSSQLDQIMERLSKLGERSLNEHEPIIKKIRQSLND